MESDVVSIEASTTQEPAGSQGRQGRTADSSTLAAGVASSEGSLIQSVVTIGSVAEEAFDDNRQRPAWAGATSSSPTVPPTVVPPSQPSQPSSGAVEHAEQPAAAQQIGQLQAELAAVKQSLATYENTLQLLVSELGTQSLPAVLQQLQHRPINSTAEQAQHSSEDTSSPARQQPQSSTSTARAQAGEANAAAAGDQGAASAPAGVVQEGSDATGSMAAGESPSSMSAGVLEPAAKQTALAQAMEQQEQQDLHGAFAFADQLPTSFDEGPADPFWRQQQWPSPLLPPGKVAGVGSTQPQLPRDLGGTLTMQHSEPLPFRGQPRRPFASGVAGASAQLSSSIGSAAGPLQPSALQAFGSAAGLVHGRPQAGTPGPYSITHVDAQLPLQQQLQAQELPPPGGPGLSDSLGSCDFLRQGFSALIQRGPTPRDGQQAPAAPTGLPTVRLAGPEAPCVGAFGSSMGSPRLGPSPVGLQAGSHAAGSLGSAVADISARPGSAASASAASAAAAGGLGGSFGHLQQHQPLSSSIGPAGALAAGSGLSLPVLAQGAQLMGLLPPLPGSSTGAGSSRQAPAALTTSPGGSLEAASGLLLQASSSVASTAPMQQPLPPPGIIHHLLTDTAGSLDLMSSLSPGAGVPGLGLPPSSAAAVAAAAAAAAAAGFPGSFGSEHSIGSFGMLSGGLSGSLPVPQSLGTAGLEHDAVPGSRSIDQYSTQQLAALQGLMQHQQPLASSSQDAAAAVAAAGSSMDSLSALQQLQAQALLAAAASGQSNLQELLQGVPGFGTALDQQQQQQQLLAAAMTQMSVKDPIAAAAAVAAAAAAAAAGGRGGLPGVDPAAALAAAAAAAGIDPSQAAGLQAQQFAQLQAAFASLNLQSQAHAELQALQQVQLIQQLQQYNAQQLLVAQAAAAAAATAALRQQQSSSSWHSDRRLSNAVAAGKLLGHGSGGSTGSSGGRRSSRGGDVLGSSTRDSRKASSTGERSSRPQGAAPDWRRIFVGNIGWWVDEEMLQRVFGEYGTILDAQVMWNTKLLAKGKRVNREFAFISYSSPEEADKAIRFMHGRYIEGLTKDHDGLTVQYEAQGVGKPASQSQRQQQPGFAPPVATQQHFLLHQLLQQQQQQQQADALHAMLQQQQQQQHDQTGYVQAAGDDVQQQQQQQQQPLPTSQQQLAAGSTRNVSGPS